jgi:hypothetical protein
LALEKDAPLRRAIQRCGAIITTPILSGLHHRYVRICFSEGTGATLHVRRAKQGTPSVHPLSGSVSLSETYALKYW